MGLVRQVGPQTREKKTGRVRIVNLQACMSPQPVQAGPQAHIKKIALVYINYFFYGLLH